MAFTVPANDLYSEIQYMLLEPRDGGVIYPSGLYTPDEVADRLNHRLREFYKRTGLVTTRDTTITTSPNTRDQSAPTNLIDIIRLGIFYNGCGGTDPSTNAVDFHDFVDDFHRPDASEWGKNWLCRTTFMDFFTPDLRSNISPIVSGNLGLAIKDSFGSSGYAEFLPLPLAGIFATGPLNHFVEVRIDSDDGASTNNYGVGASWTPFDVGGGAPASGGGYFVALRTDTTLKMILYRAAYSSGGIPALTTLVALGFDTYVLGDLLRLEVRYNAGSTDLTVLRNGVVKTTYSDVSASRWTTGFQALPFILNTFSYTVRYSYFHGGLL